MKQIAKTAFNNLQKTKSKIEKVNISNPLSGRKFTKQKFQNPEILKNYVVSDNLIEAEGGIPLTWWTHAPNFGDLLSPWLFTMITGKPVVKADKSKPHYFSIGSIAKYTNENSLVWGSGSFGTETKENFKKETIYSAVRGPLSQTRIEYSGANVPDVYGDPALLAPLFFNPRIEKVYEVGLVVRWNEKKWLNTKVGPNVKLIDLRRGDIEGVLSDFIKCKKIVSSSLHGLIIADAYNIPSAWLDSSSPTGGGFKYYDHFLAVNKVRNPQQFDPTKQTIVTAEMLIHNLKFDHQVIEFNPVSLLDACPLLKRI
ncbi:polysaccharide pyruvyl transferase family protein [Glutamicibacter sp. MNS18]|uniref:polysaccharide pyruvyl transferase family protein n=1 Tax=Glutamicibacter sp. MNS18 TaxID=2989817 RepID=UPI0022364112|nr:polysaccharide pyruvyl transferase family protein [Glutamicibacter sp. MNS18]MCW4466170.1 polysaccharide pyruvyl transferase family protein [Glutamicibacter sp. MNS18]